MLDPGDNFYFDLGALVLFLIVTGFAGAAETAISAINRVRLKSMLDRGISRAHAIEALVEDPRRSLATLLLLNTLGLIGAAAAATLAVLNATTPLGRLAAAVIAFLAIFGVQFVAKAFAARHPEGIALAVVGPIDALATVLSPLIWLFGLASRLAGAAPDESGEGMLMREEELRLLVDVGEEEGLIEAGERDMITGIFELGETVAREVMVPRIDIVAVDVNTPLHEALDTIIAHGHSRIPVYDESIDNIVGILYAKDLLKYLRDQQTDRPLKDMLRPAYFIPESKRVDDLLKELQTKRIHIAIVVDEYGGTAGLVTIEDLLEEIVGEIQDEFDVEEPIREAISPTEVVYDARVRLDDVNDELDLQLPTEDSDTLGGLVFSLLGKMPVVGDEVESDGARLQVLSVLGRRIKKVKVVKQQPPESKGDQAGVPASDMAEWRENEGTARSWSKSRRLGETA